MFEGDKFLLKKELCGYFRENGCTDIYMFGEMILCPYLTCPCSLATVKVRYTK